MIGIYRYDAENLRHEIVENGNLASFIFSHSEVVVETNTTDTIRLIRGYDIIASDSEKAKTYYHYASDELGSTTHIFEGNQLRNTYAYDAFGNITSQEETVHNRFKYTGQQHDPITQQYYLRARFYNPVIARFTQEDVYRGAGLNLYAYCDNNPVNYFDPSGYSPCPLKQALYKHYREKGHSAADANHLANIYLIARKEGEVAAKAYHQAKLAEIGITRAAEGHVKEAENKWRNKNTGQIMNSPETQYAKDFPLTARTIKDIKAAEKPNDKVHGNSHATDKPAIGYTLRDTDTGRIRKYGETTRGEKRYSRQYYKDNNVEMYTEVKGSKKDVHKWQHDKIIEYKQEHGGKRPDLNLSDY